jgi:IS4 transposase
MAGDLFNDPMFRVFAKERPVATMAQVALRHLLHDSILKRVFEEHADAQREEVISFAALTQMMASVVLSQEPSVNAAIRKMREKLGASHQAVYGKLQRVETSTSRGLVADSFQRVVALQTEFGGRGRRDIAGYETRILDGNHLAASEHRLKETRNSTAAPLPGKTLVVYCPRHNAIVDCFPIEDGHAQERSELDAVLATVRSGQLWVADRNFCTLKFLSGLAAAGARFIIRQHGQLHGTPVGTPRKIGRTAAAVVYAQIFQLPEYDGRTLVIRRVILKLRRPTRDGDRELLLLTNVPRSKADAVAIAEQYRQRWRIETVMQHLTDTLRCEIRPLCYPKAALFGFALALVMYNALSIILAAVEAAHGPTARESVSYFRLALEIAQATDGLLIVLPASRWAQIGDTPPAELARQMQRIAQGINLPYYAKTRRGPKKRQPKPQHKRRNVHVSTKKLLDQRSE